jgi:RHS repeat-associated protein
MGDVTQNRRTALLAQRSAEQAHRAAHASQSAPAQQAPQSTVGKAVSAANTALAVYGDVMGAYGKVMGFTGDLAEKAVVAVFSKLSFMQGLACLPASSQLDPVMGIDVHLVMIPPSPSPIPMPHPYIATVFNPKDFVACAVNTVTAMVPPPPPASAGLQLASTVGNMAKGMLMGRLGLNATVKLGAATPRTHSGTKNKSIPHFPMGASFAPTPILKDAGEAFFGALLVLADGEPFTGLMHLNYDCWDIGIKALMRAGGDPDMQHLYMPTGFVMAIPSHNVIISPIPTPINPIKALTKLLNFGLAKILHGVINMLPPGLRAGLHAAVCHVTGHPVDVVSGMLFTDEEDFSLPGIIPLSWTRIWFSDSSYKGPLGHGWYHNYDVAFTIDEKNNQAIYRMNDGRGVAFQLPKPGKFTYDRKEKLFLHYNDAEKFYYIEDRDGLLYRFTDKIYTDPQTRTGSHFLQSVSNRNGYALRFKYDIHGRLTNIIDSAGRTLDIENDNSGRIVNIKAPHPVELNKDFVIAHYDYDDAGNMICHTDALTQPMLYEYNNHLLVKEIWRNGHQWYFEYDGKTTGAKCIHTWGDGGIYNHKLTYTEGYTVVENSLGHTTIYYHKNGLPYIKIDGNGAEWQYRYNKFNELEWQTDPLGNQDNYSHDEWGNIVTCTDPCGGFTSTEYYHPKFPLLPTEAMDEAGGKWKLEYDEQGNLITRINPLGAKTVYSYTDGLLSKIINAAGAITRLVYDNVQNLISIETPDGAVTEYNYDVLGNCTGFTNANGVKQRIFFDLKGRTEKVHDFDGNIIYLTYDGIDNVIHFKDKQKEVEYAYHGLWKLTRRTEAGASIIFKYDSEEQIRKVINEHGLPYRFELDAAGSVIKEITFDDTIRQYERNAAGWVTQVLRPAGKFTRYTYDKNGRVTEVAYSDEKKELYVYRPSGELMQVVNETANVQFERDVMGNITKEMVNGEWITSEYDILNNRTRIISSLGADIVNSYNSISEVTQLEANGWLAKFERDKLGFETNRLLPGGISSHWKRDGIGRPIVQTVEHHASNNFNIHKRKQYQWEVNDRLKQIKDEKGTTRFEYDAWSNLAKTVFPNGEEQLRNPDAVGNLFKSIDRKDRVYAKDGQLKKANGWEYNYDAEGNLIEKKHIGGDIWRYQWNDAGMLIGVIRPDKAEISFTYDVIGRRLSKQFKNTITKYIWDGNILLHEWKEHAQTGEKLSDKSIGGDNNLVTWLFDADSFAPAAKIKGDKQYSIVTDHLGTPCQMFKSDGSLLWECELDSYGKIRVEKGEKVSCPFRYQGQYEDNETGLYYNRFRYYSAEDGVYLSQDPIRLRGGLKLYEYVHDTNDFVDILGLRTYDRRKNGQFGRKKGRPSKTKRKDRKSEYPSGYRAGVVDGVIKKHTGADGKIRDRDGNVIKRKDVTIEHDPCVVDHWNNGGNNMSRKERADYYNDPKNLSILPKGKNSSEGASRGHEDGGTYVQTTGPNYSS